MSEEKPQSVDPPVPPRRPTKNEVQIFKFDKDRRIFVAKCDVVKSALKYGFCAVLVWALHATARDVIQGRPESLKWFVEALKELRGGEVLMAVATAVCGAGWGVERKRNARLVKNCGDLRHGKEDNDRFKERSGLDTNGNAQEDKEW